ncbi:MAG TPA: multicopper oxidase domain-containing protein, partial [Longimicrobiaceae bacterium]|nr:multicopper oxidase domain-containing protein [Longimicrobiaceae bacterium]
MRETRHRTAAWPPGARVGLTALAASLLAAGQLAAQCTTSNTVSAQVVALDQAIFYNRLGAHDPTAMIFALKGDVVPNSGTTLAAGNARLRDGKRPRPITLRVNAGGCLQVTFTNYLATTARSNQPGTRAASLHVTGMQLVNSIADDGSNVGNNATSLVEPGASRTYKWFAEKEGTYLLYSSAQTTGGDGDGGHIWKGLFGAVNVEPTGSEWYRSQVTAADLALAQAKDAYGVPRKTAQGHPVINYDAVYPAGHALAGRTILKMVQNGQIVHSDLTAIITGPNKGQITTQYPAVRVEPNRHKPFREMTIIFHDEAGLVQAFDPIFEDPKLEFTLHSGRDAFAINYGTGGIGAEVLANRMGVGPMWDCNECKYEEFFLSSWAVGDPAMVVDVPADADRNGDGQPDAGKKATRAFFPDDPSNVYHSYMNDHLKIRNLHAGPKEHHIFHLHAHQWLHTPNSDNSTYLDSQGIGPGAGFTYEITYDGSSNRNKTVGDAIFHCHFYPHFAQGMWALWRVHDVFESGTVLDADGTPAAGARALPDGEIAEGTPIPGLVPMPTYALAPMPTTTMPGFPFYIPGVAGHRPPKPPLDTKFDGGLPRHVVRDGTATFPALNRLDFHKDNVTLVAQALPETGTAAEVNAMAFHARRSQPTFRFDPVTFAVVADTFITNGRPGVAGAPFADPCIDDFGRPVGTPRTYKAAGLQIDARYNKAGWHFPQHRMFSLWQDVDSFRLGVRPPEPLFFRAHTGDCVTYHLVNLIPKEYKMDDFQVRSPTDIIGQHIHLVKFDVTASDGAGNGFNYEDGSFSPGETRERVDAIRRQNACTATDTRNGTFTCPVARAHPFFGNGPNNDWIGAQETVQRWYVDDVLNQAGRDRTLRTVFTHDHFGPST